MRTSIEKLDMILNGIKNPAITIRYFDYMNGRPPVFRIELKSFREQTHKTEKIKDFYGDTLDNAIQRCYAFFLELVEKEVMELEKSI